MSSLEDEMAAQLRLIHAPEFQREYRFHGHRLWRFDFAWPAAVGGGVALEVEDGIWNNGAHNRGAGYSADIEKYNEAALLGWTVIRATTDHVKSGQALRWVERALGFPVKR